MSLPVLLHNGFYENKFRRAVRMVGSHFATILLSFCAILNLPLCASKMTSSNGNHGNNNNHSKGVANKNADAYRRRRDRNNEAARASRQNRKARHEALQLAYRRLHSAVAPLVRLRRLQAEAEVRGLCAATGQSFDALLTAAAQQIGLPADYLSTVLAGRQSAVPASHSIIDQQQQQQELVDQHRHQKSSPPSSEDGEKCR